MKRGFTLVEVVIALGVAAILFTAALTLLQGVISFNSRNSMKQQYNFEAQQLSEGIRATNDNADGAGSYVEFLQAYFGATPAPVPDPLLNTLTTTYTRTENFVNLGVTTTLTDTINLPLQRREIVSQIFPRSSVIPIDTAGNLVLTWVDEPTPFIEFNDNKYFPHEVGGNDMLYLWLNQNNVTVEINGVTNPNLIIVLWATDPAIPTLTTPLASTQRDNLPDAVITPAEFASNTLNADLIVREEIEEHIINMVIFDSTARTLTTMDTSKLVSR